MVKASAETPYLASEALKDYIITDLMGNILVRYGETFNKITDEPYFICYRFVNQQYYLRTLVKVS